MQRITQKKDFQLFLPIIICAIFYAVLAQLSNQLTVSPEKLRIIWLALPFGIFVISIIGYKANFGIWLGAFFYFWWRVTGATLHLDGVVTAILASLVVTLQAAVGAFLFQQWIGNFPTDPKIKNLLKSIGITVLISWLTPLSEFIVIHYSAIPQPNNFIQSYFTWYLGAFFSSIAILPVLMMIKLRLSQKEIDAWLPKIVLSVGFIFSLVFYINSLGIENDNLEEQFVLYSENAMMNIQSTLQRGYNGVGLLNRYFLSSENVSRSEFAEFAEPFLFGEDGIPGLVHMVWIPSVPYQERVLFETRAKQEGVIDFSFYELSFDGKKIEVSDRDEYYPVFYDQSFVSEEQMLGLDLGSISAFQVKLTDARDTGTGVVLDCAPILKSQGINRIYLVLLPVYDSFDKQGTVIKHREQFAGFVGGIFILDEWISSADPSDVTITNDEYIFDEGEVPGRQLIYSSSAARIDLDDSRLGLQPESLTNGVYAQYELGLLDAKWLYIIKPTPDYFSMNRTNTPVLIFLLGILTTFSISVYTAKNYKDMLALQDSQEKYMLLAENVNDVIWTFDMKDSRFLYVSPSVEKLCGYTADEILEKNLAQVISKTTLEHLEAVFPGRLEKFHQETEYDYLDGIELLHRDGSIILAETSTNTFLNKKTNHIELYGVLRDITWRKQAEEKLQQRDALLQISQKLSKVGGWEWNIERQEMYWTEEVYHIHDMPAGTGILAPEKAIQLGLACYPKQERQQIEDAFNRCAEEGIPYDLQSSFTTTQGRKIWVRTTAQAVREGEKITKVRGNIQDITEVKLAEEALRKSERTLQKIFDVLPIGLWFADKTGKLLRGNSKGIQIWGGEPKVGLPEYGVFKARRLPSGEEIAPEDWALAHSIREGVTIKDELLEIDAFDGKKRTILNYTAPVLDDDGELLGAIVVNQDVTHRKKMEQELEEERNSLARRVEERTADLRRSAVKLEKALIAKDEFLANMSHELRTPLTAILGLSELLNTESYGKLSERQKKYLLTIQESGEHLLALINDILDLAKATAGKLDILYTEVCVEDLCQSSLAFVQPMAERKQIKISYQSEDESLFIEADGRRVRQILVNLLNNAVKFTPDGGHVGLTVTLDKEAQEVQFIITDDGIGIAKEDVEKLFQPFTQLDSGLNRNYEGSGLGLALVRKLVDLHQGSISLQSSGIAGKGSTFIVSLPWKINQNKGLEPSETMGQETTSIPGELIDYPIAGNRTILLVEDNQANITTISDFLEMTGYRVVLAMNGCQAIEIASQYLPDLILMDIYMPVMDGLEAIRLLRSDEKFANTIIFALTALAMPGDQDRCLAAGANEFLTKPIQLKTLLNKIQSYL